MGIIQTGMAYLLLLCAAVHDIRTKELKRWMLAAAAVLGVLAAVTEWTGGNAEPVMIGASLLPGGALLTAAFLTREGIGYGDGILALLLGPVFGTEVMWAGLFLAFLLSALCSILLLACKKADRKTCLPFIPFLTSALGVVQLVFR